MHSRFILNLVLLVTIVGLVLFLTLTEEEISEIPTPTITTIPADEINSITINNISDKEIHFLKENGRWEMRLPFQVSAHPTRIKALLGILDSESIHQLNVNDVELSRFQLEPAKQILTLNNYEFRFGDINPLDKTRYILFKDQIHLIHDNLYQQLSTNPSFFINPRILPEHSIVDSIQTPDYTLSKEGENWSIDSDREMDETQINEIQKAWHELEANTIQELSFDESNNFIIININDGASIEYMIKPESESLILGRKDLKLQYHINEYRTNQIFPIENEQEGEETE